MIATVIVLGVSVAVMYHASHADELWPFGKSPSPGAVPAAPLEIPTTAEFADYVRHGLEDLTIMLAQAARKPPR